MFLRNPLALARGGCLPKDDEGMKKLIEDKEVDLGSLYFSGALKY